MAKTGTEDPQPPQIDRVPAKRPRPPRQRATNRRIAPLGYLPEIDAADQDEEPLSAEHIQALITILSKDVRALTMSTDDVAAGLQQAAWSHLRQRAQLPPSREEAGWQLDMIVWLTSRSEWIDDPKKQVELSAILNGLNPFAIGWLWSGLIQSGVACPPIARGILWKEVAPATLGKAASVARGFLKGGDYPDTDLHCTLMQLEVLFESATGKQATYYRAKAPILEYPGLMWETQEITGSRFGRLALSFFRYIEPELTPSKISSAVRSMMAARKAQSGQSLRE